MKTKVLLVVVHFLEAFHRTILGISLNKQENPYPFILMYSGKGLATAQALPPAATMLGLT